MTYDPRTDEDLHPGEGGGLHPEELGGVVVGGHVGQQGCSRKAVCCVQDQQAKKDHEGSRVSHKLQEGTAHKSAQLGKENKKTLFFSLIIPLKVYFLVCG